MLKLTDSALALLAAFSLVPLASSEAGDRDGRRIVRHHKIKLVDRRPAHRDVKRIRVVNRNVVVLNTRSDRHRHHRRHWLGYGAGDYVVIHTRNGVGQWSYDTVDSGIEALAVPSGPKVIDVDALAPNSACEMQAGVCVIRP